MLVTRLQHSASLWHSNFIRGFVKRTNHNNLTQKPYNRLPPQKGCNEPTVVKWGVFLYLDSGEKQSIFQMKTL